MNASGGTLNMPETGQTIHLILPNFTKGGGTVKFNGSAAQNIGGANINAGGYAFNSVTIVNTSAITVGVTLSKPITVATTFTPSAGCT